MSRVTVSVGPPAENGTTMVIWFSGKPPASPPSAGAEPDASPPPPVQAASARPSPVRMASGLDERTCRRSADGLAPPPVAWAYVMKADLPICVIGSGWPEDYHLRAATTSPSEAAARIDASDGRRSGRRVRNQVGIPTARAPSAS